MQQIVLDCFDNQLCHLSRTRKIMERNEMTSKPSARSVRFGYGIMTLTTDDETDQTVYVCPECGAPMIIIETFVRQHAPNTIK